MATKIYSYKDAKKYLESLKINEREISSLLEGRVITERYLKLIKRTQQLLHIYFRSNSISQVFSAIDGSTAGKQVKKIKSIKLSTDINLLEKFIKKFEIIKKDFNKKGIYVYFSGGGQERSTISLHLAKKEVGSCFTSFFFDIYYNKSKKPSVILGNMHGNPSPDRKKILDAFVLKLKEPILNTIIKSFQKAFPGKDQSIAFNPRHFIEIKNPWKASVVYTMKAKRLKVTPESVKKSMAEIPSRAIGMHKAAFKKTGYELPKDKPKSKRKKFFYLRRGKQASH